MKVRRDIASIPVRSARETWRAIVDLITGSGSTDRNQLDAAASVMESLIADELPAKIPIVVKGSGPRLVIHLLYDEAAMEASKDIDKLTWNPTEGNWRMTAPAEDEDIGWMNKTLSVRAARITVHDADTDPDTGKIEKGQAVAEPLNIDWGALSKP